MKLVIAVGWLLVVLVVLNIAIAHAHSEAIPTVSPEAMEQSTEEITPEPLTSTLTPSPTFTSVPEATPTATASWIPISTNTEVTLEAVMPTNTLEVVASETTSALTATPSVTATLETQTMPTPSSATLSPSATSVASTPTLTPTEAVSPSISPTSASQPSPTLDISITSTFQPTEMATTTSTVNPVTVSPAPTAIPSASRFNLNFYIESALDPIVLGETFELRIVASEAFNTAGLETAGICAYDGNFLTFPDGSTPEAGTWHFRIAVDLNEDDVAVASTNITAIAIGQSTVTCVLQGVDGEETISSFQAVELQVISPLQLSVAVSTHSSQPINATLSNAEGTAVASVAVIEGGIHFGNLAPGVYILRVTQPEHLSAVGELVIEDTALNVNCELVFGDLDGDEDIDGEDLTILQTTYRSLTDLRFLAANLYFTDNTSCFVETSPQASVITLITD